MFKNIVSRGRRYGATYLDSASNSNHHGNLIRKDDFSSTSNEDPLPATRHVSRLVFTRRHVGFVAVAIFYPDATAPRLAGKISNDQ